MILTNIVHAKTCNYEYTVWNAHKRMSTKTIKVNKNYKDINPSEMDQLGCTPCEVDQINIKLINNLEFTICKKIASKVKTTLNKLIANNYKIESIVGQRAQMSKGLLNKYGERTELSNHSFGTALDINEKMNGLYTNCIEFNDRCILLKGGRYHPNFGINANDELVSELKKIGLIWGGEIKGKQKDFMHFSLTGY